MINKFTGKFSYFILTFFIAAIIISFALTGFQGFGSMNGLVGYVYRLTPNYADILTILDQNNRVDSIVARTRTHGIVEGISEFKCRLKYVNRTEKVEVGDEIITAGLGNIYPKGIKVGKITQIDKENYGITQSIVVTPSVNFHKLEEVVVLIEKEEKTENRDVAKEETNE